MLGAVNFLINIWEEQMVAAIDKYEKVLYVPQQEADMPQVLMSANDRQNPRALRARCMPSCKFLALDLDVLLQARPCCRIMLRS